jgi:hypothetical protein
MYEAVLITCRENQSAWEGIPAFVEVLSQFETALTDLKTLSVEQTKDLTWHSSQKSLLFKKCVLKAYELNKILEAFASKTGNTALLNQIAVKKSVFVRGGEYDKINRVSNVIENLTANLGSLAEFGIGSTELDELSAMKAELLNMIAAPRMAIINRIQKTEKMSEIVTLLESILKMQIDSLITILKPTHAEFYSKYKSARSVIPYGSRHNKPGEAPIEPDEGIPV